MAETHDVIIAGLGAMGSAAAFHLAQRGIRVLGFDRFAPPHTKGSTHGKTRVIRQAYFEDPAYVPIVQRAYQLWRELEGKSRMTLMVRTGGLMIGRPDSEVVVGSTLSAEQHGLEHEVLSRAEVVRRYPCLRPDRDMIAVYEPEAGILFPEACVSAHLEFARSFGAQIRLSEPLLGWEADDNGVSVTTEKATYRAERLVISVGSWAGQLLADLQPPLTVERQIQFWFDPIRSHATFAANRCPVHLWQFDANQVAYGIPDLGDGVKFARHHGGVSLSPDHLRDDVDAQEIADARTVVRRFFPDADGPLRSTAVCLYTNTPDQHFWLDRHPIHENVLIASPCSGHGFKFSSAIGEILADLATGRTPPFDLSLFRQRWRLPTG